jgi:hypothetical protein
MLSAEIGKHGRKTVNRRDMMAVAAATLAALQKSAPIRRPD